MTADSAKSVLHHNGKIVFSVTFVILFMARGTLYLDALHQGEGGS